MWGDGLNLTKNQDDFWENRWRGALYPPPRASCKKLKGQKAKKACRNAQDCWVYAMPNLVVRDPQDTSPYPRDQWQLMDYCQDGVNRTEADCGKPVADKFCQSRGEWGSQASSSCSRAT